MQTTDITKLYWIWLAEGLGQGSRLAAKLLEEYEDAKAIYEAKDADLRLFRSWRDNDLLQFTQLLKNRELQRATEILNQCRKNAIEVLTYDDPAFPPSLRALSNPPLVLYYRGTLPDTVSNCTIGVVGTRTMTDYGRDMAYSIGAGLASGGAIVVSGLALGADSMAMAGAMDACGVTVGVLGCGVDVVYPPSHRPLYEQVLARGGCILSEYPPLARPIGFHFPIRNRIISGLSDGVVVVEADSKSGALITARHAVYQGKTLFAVPGQVGVKTAEGPNALLRDGALPVLSAADILEEFAFPYAKTVHPEKAAQFAAKWNGSDRAREAMERDQIGVRGKDTYYGKQTYGGRNPAREPTVPPQTVPVEPPDNTEVPVEAHVQPATGSRGIAGWFRRGDETKNTSKNASKGVSGRQKGATVESEKKKSEKKSASAKKIDLKSLDEAERKVYNTMKPNVPMAADELVRDDLPISRVLAALTMLEMIGAVEAGKGGYYMRTDPDDAPGRLVEDGELES